MKTFKKIIAWITVAVGVIFMMNTASDIQLGFGVVLISQGLLNI